LVGEARKVGGRRSLTACVERAPPQKNGNTRQTYCFAKDTGMRAGGGGSAWEGDNAVHNRGKGKGGGGGEEDGRWCRGGLPKVWTRTQACTQCYKNRAASEEKSPKVGQFGQFGGVAVGCLHARAHADDVR